MDLKNRIKEVFQALQKSGSHITIDSIITHSLFSSGGSLAGFDDEISSFLWEVRQRIENRVNRQYPNGSNIVGFAVGAAVNDFFNHPESVKFNNNK